MLLQYSRLALVTSIDDCPAIADGEGSVVTARLVFKQNDEVVLLGFAILVFDPIDARILGTFQQRDLS